MITLYNLPSGSGLSEDFFDKYTQARDLGKQVDGITSEPEARELAIKESQLAAGIDAQLRALVQGAPPIAAGEATNLLNRYLEEIPPMLAAVRAAVLNRRDETGVHTPTPIISATPDQPALSPVATPVTAPWAFPAATTVEPPSVEVVVDPVGGTATVTPVVPVTASLSPGIIGAGLAALGVGAYFLLGRKGGGKKRRR
jgi:hypothetical protein